MTTPEINVLAEHEYKKVAVTRKVHSWTDGFVKGFEMRNPEVEALKRHIAALERLIRIAYDGR